MEVTLIRNKEKVSNKRTGHLEKEILRSSLFQEGLGDCQGDCRRDPDTKITQ